MVLPQRHRLRKRRDFAVVYQQGMRLSGPSLLLRLKRQAQPTSNSALNSLVPPEAIRIGISISQKVSKLAVVRNRLKRQIRAACYQLLPQLQPGWDLVIVVRSGSVAPSKLAKVEVAKGGGECDYWKILQELKQLLLEAKILHGH
jgi:ribonuclease P protein component